MNGVGVQDGKEITLVPKDELFHAQRDLYGALFGDREWFGYPPAFYPPDVLFAVLADGQLVGRACLWFDQEYPDGQINVWIHDAYWKRGYGTAAIRAAVAWLHSEGVDLVRVRCGDSRVSHRIVIERAGGVLVAGGGPGTTRTYEFRTA